MTQDFHIAPASALHPGMELLRTEAINEGFLFVDRLVRDWISGSNRFDLPGRAIPWRLRRRNSHRRMRDQSRSLSRSSWDWQATAPLHQTTRTSPWRRLRAAPADARRGKQRLPHRAPQNDGHGSGGVLPAAWVCTVRDETASHTKALLPNEPQLLPGANS